RLQFEKRLDRVTWTDVLAFLKGAFAGHPIRVAELEVKARTAMLLGERQSITHSKLFKRAKKALGIRSVRDGFGATGEWFWAFPQNPGLDGAQTTGHSSNAAKPEQVSGLEHQLRQGGIGVPRQWVDGIASLHRQRPPADVPAHRWRLFVA